MMEPEDAQHRCRRVHCDESAERIHARGMRYSKIWNMASKIFAWDEGPNLE